MLKMRKNVKNLLILLLGISFVASVVFISVLYLKERDKNAVLMSENEILSQKEENFAPMCDFGRCPLYRSYDIDGDEGTESVVEVPIAMTKGAGEIWIIDEGRVVFKSEGHANIGYEVPGYGIEDNGNGIFVTYTKEYDETGLRPKVWATEEWRYENGDYVLKNTVFVEK